MREIIEIFAPTIDLSLDGNISIDDVEYGSGDKTLDKPYRYSKIVGDYYPAIDINGMLFSGQNIVNMELDVIGFLPTISITIKEPKGLFGSQHYPTDGDVIKLYVRSKNADFKPIRQNYRILTHDGISSNKASMAGVYTFTGVLDLPGLSVDKIKSFPNMLSIDVLMAIAEELGLGFATNGPETDDTMTWICPGVSYMDFIQNDVLAGAYKNDESFFTAFIDEYYYLNFVQVNELLTHDAELSVETLNYLMQSDTLPDDTEEVGKYESEFFLSNSKLTAGTPNQISAYAPIGNPGYEFMDNGYRTYIQYYNKSEDAFSDTFMETLTSEDTSVDMIVQKGKEREDHTTMIKSIYVGDQFNANVHPSFYFAKLQNNYNISELKKLSLKINLASMNPNIYRYKVCPVMIIVSRDDVLQSEVEEEDHEELAVDTFNSGYYVARGIRLIYAKGNFYNQILLSKREYSKSRFKLNNEIQDGE
jgi:hypothetical protein